MKVVQINPYCGKGSTGKICQSISERLVDNQIENYILYTQYNSDYNLGINYGINKKYVYLQSLISKIKGNNGFNNIKVTKNLINEIEKISPDIVHLHNLHAQNCNLEMLTTYLSKQDFKVCWTFHDCWLFTGYCMYYDMFRCEKWKTGCNGCKHRLKYSWFIDNANNNWQKKKNISDMLDCNIIAPSKWLANEIKESIWKNHNIYVINNGINLKVFNKKSNDLFTKYHSKNQFVILGVADLWDNRKGIDVFISLSKYLSKKYKIVLVGTNHKVEKKLPANIDCIKHTHNQEELAHLYSSADVFVNPTRDEVFGMVNIESLACGTPVVTFDTGGSPECIDENTGIVVKKNDIDDLIDSIVRVCESNDFSAEKCIERAYHFDENILYDEYIDLYKKL
ncbi:glycosyltransferase [Thomasclavelia ramosa]|uniref:Glycosyltransferase n=1 Tax=Thomasclavelia ramosa TaxID=1547 RepID=A0A3E3E9L9_9FIRM|nr:glycosyltransferase [Thomasclavelia ramosa]RGD78465.1 glycosyltransferase [Thomasclavelia ramosa]